MKKTLLVAWIGTGKYRTYFNRFFESFIKHIVNKNPNWRFVIDIFSDSTDLKIIQNFPVLSISMNYIEDMEWPIIALRKFIYCNRSCKNHRNFDYFLNCNANTEFVRDIKLEDIVRKGKLSAVHHHAWEKMGKDPLKFTFDKPIDFRSEASIVGPYEYHNSGFIIGDLEYFLSASAIMIDWYYHDIAKNIIPMWHDESYWNKYINKFPNTIFELPQEFIINETDEWEQEHYPNHSAVYFDSSKTQKDKDFYILS